MHLSQSTEIPRLQIYVKVKNTQLECRYWVQEGHRELVFKGKWLRLRFVCKQHRIIIVASEREKLIALMMIQNLGQHQCGIEEFLFYQEIAWIDILTYVSLFVGAVAANERIREWDAEFHHVQTFTFWAALSAFLGKHINKTQKATNKKKFFGESSRLLYGHINVFWNKKLPLLAIMKNRRTVIYWTKTKHENKRQSSKKFIRWFCVSEFDTFMEASRKRKWN